LAIYPLPPMNGSSMPASRQHEECSCPLLTAGVTPKSRPIFAATNQTNWT